MKNHNGFTLIEILIAMFIFSLIALTVSLSLKTILKTQEDLKQNINILSKLQLTIFSLQKNIKTNTTLSGSNNKLIINKKKYKYNNIKFYYLTNKHKLLNKWPDLKYKNQYLIAIEAFATIKQWGKMTYIFIVNNET